MKAARAPTCSPLFEVLAGAGFAWFSIDYRLAPGAHHKQANEDVVSAIQAVKANAAKYHVDVTKIALIGESAGGFLVNYRILDADVVIPTAGALVNDGHEAHAGFDQSPSQGNCRPMASGPPPRGFFNSPYSFTVASLSPSNENALRALSELISL